MIITFFSPYFYAALSGAYSLLQNLQALGVISIWNGPYIDLQGTVNVISGFYFLSLLLLITFNIFSSFAFSKKVTIALSIFWIMPGVLSLCGVTLIEPAIPENYIIGSGHLGTTQGALINAFYIFVLSWSLSTIILHGFRAGKKVKASFDHIWYLFGISAIVFFVSDMDTNRYKEDFSLAKNNLDSSLKVLESQFGRVQDYCAGNEFNMSFENLCSWSTPAKNYITQLYNDSDVSRSLSEKPTLAILLSLSENHDSKVILEEIRRLNSICISEPDVSGCIEVPMHLNQHPELIDGEVNVFTKYIIPSHALMPTVERYWVESNRLSKKVKSQKNAPHRRWVFFMLLAFLVGIKVSNSSRELFTTKPYSVYRSNAKVCVRFIVNLIGRFITRTTNLVRIRLTHMSLRASSGKVDPIDRVSGRLKVD